MSKPRGLQARRSRRHNRGRSAQGRRRRQRGHYACVRGPVRCGPRTGAAAGPAPHGLALGAHPDRFARRTRLDRDRHRRRRFRPLALCPRRLARLGGALDVAGLASIAFLAILIREIAGLARLSRIATLRETAQDAADNDDRDKARRVVCSLIDLYRSRPETARGRAEVQANIREIIDSHALIRLIAGLYGGRPGGLALMRLTRLTLAHLAVTGGVAMTDSLVQQVVGHGLTARLSARLGEGVVNGLMTARIGVAAIEVCRPLPHVGTDPVSIGEIMREIVPVSGKQKE